MEATRIVSAVENGVAHVEMARPDKFNAMDGAFFQQLGDGFRALGSQAAVRAVVLSGRGKHFTAGMDLAVFQRPDGIVGQRADPHLRAEKFRGDLKTLQEAFTCLDQARVPVIAAVQGGCIGAGVDMISACDIRFATKDAFFCIQEINIGMTADVGDIPVRVLSHIAGRIINEVKGCNRVVYDVSQKPPATIEWE